MIIGAAPRTRFASALYAGTGEALVQKADCPVMLVPAGAPPPTGNRVAVTYDTSGASESAAAVAAHLASALEGCLTVIHVLPDPRSYTRPVLPMRDDVRSVVEAALDGEELDLRHVFAYRLPAAHLAQTVAQLQPAFLAVAAPKRGLRSLVSAVPRRAAAAKRIVSGRRRPGRSSRPVQSDDGRSASVNAISNEIVRIYKAVRARPNEERTT